MINHFETALQDFIQEQKKEPGLFMPIETDPVPNILVGMTCIFIMRKKIKSGLASVFTIDI